MLAFCWRSGISSLTIIVFEVWRALWIAAWNGSRITGFFSQNLTVPANWGANWGRSHIPSLAGPAFYKLRAKRIAHRLITEIPVITELVSYSFGVSTYGDTGCREVKISSRTGPFWTISWTIRETSSRMIWHRMILIPVITSLSNDSSVSADGITKWCSVRLQMAFPSNCHPVAS